jgi:hypothetical protein
LSAGPASATAPMSPARTPRWPATRSCGPSHCP